MNSKRFFASKTILFNLAVGLLAALEVMQTRELSWQTICLGLVAGINTVLRLTTKKQIR